MGANCFQAVIVIRQRESFWLLVKVISAYIGAVIGAGFASGQEIMQFFILHGKSGLMGAALATILFAYLGGLVMFLSITMHSSSYKKVFGFLLGNKAGRFMDILNLCMLLGGVGVMMAGSAAVFIEHFALPARVGIWSVAVLTSLVLMGGLEGVLTANVCLVPLKYLAVLAISLTALSSHPGGLAGISASAAAGGGITGSWALAGFLYVSYNMVVPVAVLSSLGQTVPLKTGLAGGVLGGLLLGLAIFLVTAAGLAHQPEAASYQIPMLYLAGSFSPVLRSGLGLLIWLAILTTMIANAHGFASRLAPAGGARYRLYGIGACLLALPLAGFSFTGLVRFLYPLFGYAGLVLLIALLVRPLFCFFRNR
ncbi:MAG: hypothetical protein PHF87_10200 [Desulfotomaculaceae bacterium]|nr:hypothetical protein [Desulfotomaculaceae bacterium]